MRHRFPLTVTAILALSVSLLAGCAATKDAPAPDRSGRAVLPEASVRPLLKKVVSRSIAPTPVMRLAPGLVPPTNRWFSGLVFGKTPQPVFPFPLAFSQTPTGFSAGLPTVTASAKTILGTATSTLSVDLGATDALVSAYDEVSVTLQHRAGGRTLGTTTIAEGSPLVSYRAAERQTVRLGGSVVATGGGRGTVTRDGLRWAVVTRSATVDGANITLDKGGSLVLFPVPSGAGAGELRTLMDAAAAPLESVQTSYAAESGRQRTSLAYRNGSDRPGLVVPLPHQGKAAQGCTQLTYSTVYGTVPLCVASRLSFTTPTVNPVSSLDLTRLSGKEKKELGDQLKVDVATAPTFATDTYFGGKSLFRSATLLQLARQLGDKESAATLTAALVAQLDKWTEPRGCTTRGQECFVYDPKLKMMVGLVNSFGSEEGNDHHFQYGYFLYAAGVVAQDDPKLAKRWAPVLDLLAADIASRNVGTPGTSFPTSRVFDPYFSHSWASGYSPFADGNNQESSSEAVTAWTGLSLWAAARGDSALAGEAAWLLSSETASALAYWINPRLTGPQFAGYSSAMVSLNWGNKRDFATWFSPEPSAIVGIQLIPMAPVSSYLGSSAAGGPGQIQRLVTAAAPSGFNVPFGDYLLMYRALAGRQQAADVSPAMSKGPL